jgi:hypothetical protein
MVTTDKDIKLKNAGTEEKMEVCIEAVVYFLSGNKEEKCFYEISHEIYGMCGVSVYETKTLIVATYKVQKTFNE